MVITGIIKKRGLGYQLALQIDVRDLYVDTVIYGLILRAICFNFILQSRP